MSPPKYNVVEPHPQPSTSYLHIGRGGAGNIVKAKDVSKGSNATGPPSRVALEKRRPSNTFISGRGGLGNVHPSSERAIFSFDEELERQMKQESDLPPVFHVGRGGAGNYSAINDPTRYRSSVERRTSETSSAKSGTSTGSVADAANAKFRRSLERGWDRLIGH